MAYTKTAWINDAVPALDAVNLNKIEQGIYDAHQAIAAIPAGSVIRIGVHEPTATLSGDLTVAVPANTYRSLIVRLKARRNTTFHAACSMQFNADTTPGNYGGSEFYTFGTNSGPSSTPGDARVGYVTGTDSSGWLVSEAVVFDPNSSDFKQFFARATFRDAGGSYYTYQSGALWAGTVPISAVRILQPTGGFVAGSKLAVYGVV